MRLRYNIVLIFILGLVSLCLISCQAQSVRPLTSNPPDREPDPATEPLVKISFDGYDPETTTLRFGEGQTVIFELDTLNSRIREASLSQSSGPSANFGEVSVGGKSATDGDIMDGDGINDIRFTLQDVEGPRLAVIKQNARLRAEFVMPSVSGRTTMTFQFRSASATESRLRTISIIIEDDAGAITLTGKVSKGLVSNTRVKLFSVDGFIDDFINERQVVEPVQIDSTGTYNFTLLPAIDFEELLLYKIEADGADMVCDAPKGCRVVEFGETFEVEKDLDLRAYIRVPQMGTINTVNINILTTLTARSAQELAEGFERVDAEDVSRAQREAAGIFGLPIQDFTTVPFIDVTQPITSRDENAIRVAMIGGGILGAAFAHSDPDDDDDYLEEIKDFISEFKKGETPCRDSAAQKNLSIEDIFVSSFELSRINGSATTQQFFSERLNGLRNGNVSCSFLSRVAG